MILIKISALHVNSLSRPFHPPCHFFFFFFFFGIVNFCGPKLTSFAFRDDLRYSLGVICGPIQTPSCTESRKEKERKTSGNLGEKVTCDEAYFPFRQGAKGHTLRFLNELSTAHLSRVMLSCVMLVYKCEPIRFSPEIICTLLQEDEHK